MRSGVSGASHDPAQDRERGRSGAEGTPSIDLSLFDPARFQDGHADRGDRGPDAE